MFVTGSFFPPFTFFRWDIGNINDCMILIEILNSGGINAHENLNLNDHMKTSVENICSWHVISKDLYNRLVVSLLLHLFRYKCIYLHTNIGVYRSFSAPLLTISIIAGHFLIQ